MEERYHETTQNRFYSDMSKVNKNITVEAKFISPRTYNCLPEDQPTRFETCKRHHK